MSTSQSPSSPTEEETMSDFKRLFIPWMDSQTFELFQDLYRGMLRRRFSLVGSPNSGPGQERFTTMKIIVSGRKHHRHAVGRHSDDFKDIFRDVGGIRKLRLENTLSIAIPCMVQGEQAQPAEGAEPFAVIDGYSTFVRLDVTVLCCEIHQRWALFTRCHGVFWDIFMSLVRPYGFSIDDEGLYASRAPSEALDNKDTAVWLTCTPEAMFAYFGLSCSRFWCADFTDNQEMFEFIARSSLFSTHGSLSDHRGMPDRAAITDENERKYNESVIRAWYEEFLPAKRAEGARNSLHPRNEVIHFARSYFNVDDESLPLC